MRENLIDSDPFSLVEALEQWASLTPEKVAIISPEGILTYIELNHEVNSLASTLLNSGALPGEIVASFLPKDLAFAVCFLASQKAGLIFTSINPNTKPEILTHQLNLFSGTYFAIPKELQQSQLCRIITNSNPNAVIFHSEIVKNRPSRLLQWPGLSGVESSNDPSFSFSVESPCYLNFSSGTTSFPKAAVATHANIYWNTRAAVSALGLRQSDVHLCTFPTYLHPHEILARPIYLGGTAVLVDFDLQRIWQLILKNEVTCVMSNPSIYRLLIDKGKHNREKPTSVRLAESGGSIQPTFLSESIPEYLGARFVPVWGSAETMGIALATTNSVYPLPDFILGRVCPTYQIEVVDPVTDLEVPHGELGEMRIKGPAVSSGYLGARESGRTPFRDGWYYTGDMVTRHPNGDLYLCGREHDMIKSRGFKVFPFEVEAILKQYPGVEDAVVLGIMDARRGETIVALIVPKVDQSVSLRNLLEYCKTKLEPFKLPTKFRFFPNFSLNPNEKLSRRQLASLFSGDELGRLD